VKTVKQKFLVVFGLFFLFLFLSRTRALPTIVCDKDVYYALQKFDAYCNITNDLTQDITVWNYTLLFPIDSVIFKPYVRANVTYNDTVLEFCPRNLTINGSWVYNSTDGLFWAYVNNTYCCPMDCLNIYSIDQTNDTCEYNGTCWGKEERWEWRFVDLTLPFEMLAGETKEFKFHVEVPIGTSGKFNVTAIVFYDSENITVSLDPWWNSSWQYRRNITINNTQNPNTLIDYQVAINLTYDENMSSDFSDIRFTYYNSTSNSETEIPYWIESKQDSSWAYVWVRVPEIPASGYTTVYVYYGNTSFVSSKSNASETFDIYDDWTGSDGSAWSSQWNTTSGTNVAAGSTIDIQNNTGRIFHKSSSDLVWSLDYGKGNKNYLNFSKGIRYKFEWFLNSSNYDAQSGSFHNFFIIPTYPTGSVEGESNYLRLVYAIGTDGTGKFRLRNKTDGVLGDLLTYYYNPNDKWETLIIDINSTHVRFTMNNTVIQDWTLHNLNFDSATIYFTSTTNEGGYYQTQSQDNLIVRKYSEPEPTYSIGSEETVPAVYISITFNYNQVNFGTVNHNSLVAAPNQANGIYNCTVDTNADYEVYARGYDFTGPASLSISNLYFDTNETASNLSYSDAITLSTSDQLIDTNIPYTYTTNYHGYWLNIPYKQRAGTYNTTVVITYSNV